MNPRPLTEADAPELALALPALKRAGRRAQEIAMATKTNVVVFRDGQILVLGPSLESSAHEAK